MTEEQFNRFLQGECQHKVTKTGALMYAFERGLFPANKIFIYAFRLYIYWTKIGVYSHLSCKAQAPEEEFKYVVKLKKLRGDL